MSGRLPRIRRRWPPVTLRSSARTLFDALVNIAGQQDCDGPIWRGRRRLNFALSIWSENRASFMVLRGGFPCKSCEPNEPMPPIEFIDTVSPARLADDDRKRKGDGGPGTAVITKTKPQTKRPNLYRVLLLNDDYTPMEFVVHVLERFFNKDAEAAHRIMMHVHQHGIGECGVFTYEVAETKVTQVMDFARKHQHPLQCIMEKK
jgi:ATP-dependent Clp protease adaptor protein ClpS